MSYIAPTTKTTIASRTKTAAAKNQSDMLLILISNECKIIRIIINFEFNIYHVFVSYKLINLFFQTLRITLNKYFNFHSFPLIQSGISKPAYLNLFSFTHLTKIQSVINECHHYCDSSNIVKNWIL